MKFKRIEVFVAFCIAVLFAYTALISTAQATLSNDVLRLHVVAHSDDTEEQQVKLLVRDAILAYLAPVLDNANDQTEVRQRVTKSLPEIATIAQRVLMENGMSHSVLAKITAEYYPSRKYAINYALPAGQYVGLRVELGEGTGENWWCVIFPPLCADVAQQESTVLNDETTFGFKLAEILGECRAYFK